MKHSVSKLFFGLFLSASLVLLPIPCFAENNYTQQAQQLHDLGLYSGISTDTFDPDLSSALNRETGIVMLLRLFGLEGAANAMTESEVNEALSRFSDAGSISSWAKQAVAYAAANGLIAGTTTTTFSPKNSLNGKAYCTLILRQLGYEVLPQDYPNSPLLLAENGGLAPSEANRLLSGNPLIKDDMETNWSLPMK